MVDAHEEYVAEQRYKRVSRECYDSAKLFWNKATDAFSESKDNAPYVVCKKQGTGFTFTFSKGSDEDTPEKMIEVLGKKEENGETTRVILPIQFQEWYYREPRYSDEYVRYQLSKKLEDFVQANPVHTDLVKL